MTYNKPVPKFELLGLKEKLLQGVFAYGWEVPSHIQQKALLPLIKGCNIYCQAQAGQGKSGVFVIGSLQIVDDEQPDLQATVITPVKELAQQSYEVFRGIGSYMKTHVRLSIGGSKLIEEKAAYSASSANPVQIAVGTPGRITELVKKKFLETSRVKLLIVDEADKLLGDDFAEAVSQLIQALPSDVQIGLVSATIPQKMMEISKGVMQDAEQIFIRDNELPPA